MTGPRASTGSPSADKGPDPSPTCPRCHYFEQTARERSEAARPELDDPWPLGIDQIKAQEILLIAFPPNRR